MVCIGRVIVDVFIRKIDWDFFTQRHGGTEGVLDREKSKRTTPMTGVVRFECDLFLFRNGSARLLKTYMRSLCQVRD